MVLTQTHSNEDVDVSDNAGGDGLICKLNGKNVQAVVVRQANLDASKRKQTYIEGTRERQRETDRQREQKSSNAIDLGDDAEFSPELGPIPL